jgi:hypothetical protein
VNVKLNYCNIYNFFTTLCNLKAMHLRWKRRLTLLTAIIFWWSTRSYKPWLISSIESTISFRRFNQALCLSRYLGLVLGYSPLTSIRIKMFRSSNLMILDIIWPYNWNHNKFISIGAWLTIRYTLPPPVYM